MAGERNVYFHPRVFEEARMECRLGSQGRAYVFTVLQSHHTERKNTFWLVIQTPAPKQKYLQGRDSKGVEN